jgi:hypothetical protein
MGLAVMSTLNSCLNDDDNNNNDGLSQEQIHSCYLQMAGEHTGKLIYQKYEDYTNLNLINDSIDVSWTVDSDSIITVHNVPTSALGAQVQSNVLKTAIEEAGKVDMRIFYLPYNTSPVSFMLYPYLVEVNVFMNNATHAVTIGFATSSYSWGSYENSKMRMQLVLYGVYLDDSTYSYLTSQVPMVIEEI